MSHSVVFSSWLIVTGSGPTGYGSAYGNTSPVSSRYGGITSPISEAPSTRPQPSSGFNSAGSTGGGAESWKRAAEVTQNLKARIEMMKV